MALFVDDHNGHPPPKKRFPYEVKRKPWTPPPEEAERWLDSDEAAGEYTSFWKGYKLFYAFSDANTAFEYRLRFT